MTSIVRRNQIMKPQTIFERQPDVEALFEFNGAKKHEIASGYRPAHLIKDGYLTTGVHKYHGAETVAPDGKATGTITFITPEVYPNCLWIGKKMNIQEGNRIVGYATVLKIFNPLLLADQSDV